MKFGGFFYFEFENWQHDWKNYCLTRWVKKFFLLTCLPWSNIISILYKCISSSPKSLLMEFQLDFISCPAGQEYQVMNRYIQAFNDGRLQQPEYTSKRVLQLRAWELIKSLIATVILLQGLVLLTSRYVDNGLCY